jgi:DedD protein
MSGQPGKATADEQGEQRTALLRRVAVAGGMIAMLIGALAVFDASRRPKEEAPAPQAKPEAPVSVPTAVAEAPPLPPAEETPVEASPVNLQELPPPLPEGTALPDKAETAQMPERQEKPGKADRPETAAPAPAPIPRTAAPTTGRLVIGHETPAPAAPVPAISRAPAPQPTGPVQGYVVQVGVFSSVANAEEVRARLALNGIPSQIEARVHVGPFKSRAEADAARVRLRAIGMDSGTPAPVRSPAARP